MIAVGKWAVGTERGSGNAIVRFSFSDREPLDFQIPKEQALAFARAIIDQCQNPPAAKSN